MKKNDEWLTIALPKGRVCDAIDRYMRERGIFIDFSTRSLMVEDDERRLRFILVKNSDLPTYITHGIAGLGICGEDVILESGCNFLQLCSLPIGKTVLSLAAPKNLYGEGDFDRAVRSQILKVATSYPRMTRAWFHNIGRPVEIIRLAGSVEIAPTLGLCNCISDLVESGATLKANNLEIIRKIRNISLFVIANNAYYKLYYHCINDFMKMISPSH